MRYILSWMAETNYQGDDRDSRAYEINLGLGSASPLPTSISPYEQLRLSEEAKKSLDLGSGKPERDKLDLMTDSATD